MTVTSVRKATDQDAVQLAEVLAKAFQDDPAFSWAVPSAERRRRHAPKYFELTLRRVYLPKSEVYTTEDLQAVALWAPPDSWQTPMTATLAMAPTIIRACGRHTVRALKVLTSMEAKHKEREEPHYYLPFVGVEPASQGRGYGNALLSHMLDRCDAEGRPAYLEATSLRNQALYHRHGFKVLEELHWPGGGPAWWPMWRDARS
jgi:ribosomal protein S18 acetylase RimI-like enzyme